MWQQYKKTFLGVQVIAGLSTAWVYFGLRMGLLAAGLIFLVMQVSAIPGAMWANRIRRRVLQQQA
jgi:hypothetical protein